jgi:hypothetical protein
LHSPTQHPLSLESESFFFCSQSVLVGGFFEKSFRIRLCLFLLFVKSISKKKNDSTNL